MAEEKTIRICAIIVTYHPDLAVLKRIVDVLRPQTQRVIVVDNGRTADFLELWPEGEEESPVVLSLWRNRGIAAAHNKGIAWARAHGYSHVLIMDHDSVPAHDMVSRLIEAASELEQRGVQLAAVGPRYVDPYVRHSSYFVQFKRLRLKQATCADPKQNIVPADFLISSGCLVSMKTLDVVGSMDESLFIDHVDTEWFLRARAKGFKAFGVCSAVMEHSLGNGTIRFWFGRRRNVPKHGPLRHYYIFRNSLLLYRRTYSPANWIAADVSRLAFMFLFYSLFTRPRKAHLRMMVSGLWDGICGKTGKWRA